MTAPLFFVDRLMPDQESAVLSVEDSRHALRSLRLRRGEELTLSDGQGKIAGGRLRGEEDGLAVVDLEEVRRVLRQGPVVSVAMAPPKGDRLSWAVQKLAELGVDEVLLIRTERSVRAWDSGRAARSSARLRLVAREAAMQARRPFVAEIDTAVELSDALVTSGAPAILLTEGADMPVSEALPDRPDGIRLLIGPEGGFSEAEVEAARGSGGLVAGLGEAILRTETAALVAATLVLARYGRLG